MNVLSIAIIKINSKSRNIGRIAHSMVSTFIQYAEKIWRKGGKMKKVKCHSDYMWVAL